MKTDKISLFAGSALVLASASMARAGGLDLSVYSPNILFEQGNYIEGSYSRVDPDIDASAQSIFTSGISDIAPYHTRIGFGAKLDISDRIAIAYQTYDNFGATIYYRNLPLPFDIIADVEGRAHTGTVKFDLDDSFSIYGGVKHLVARGKGTSLADPTDNWTFDRGRGTGFILGAAYSKPDIALRVSLTYESGFDVDLPTTRSILGFGFTGTTTAKVPEAWTLHFQTGIAPRTLLFGSVRHAGWSDANIILLNDASDDKFAITDFSDSLTWDIGLGYQVTDKLSVSVTGTYEDGDGKPSTLQPTDGRQSIGAGFKYKLTEQVEFSAGVSHTWLGDNKTKPMPVAVSFTDNNVWAFGTKVGLRF